MGSTSPPSVEEILVEEKRCDTEDWLAAYPERRAAGWGFPDEYRDCEFYR